MVSATVKTIPIKHCNFDAKVKTAGSGPPLVYLHAAGGPLWDPFVEGLCERYTVYAPHHPGTGETAREEAHTASIQVEARKVGVWWAASVFDLGTRPMRLFNAR